MPRSSLEITTSDVPQAPNLARIRCVVTAIAGGSATIEQIAEETDISARHVGYTLRAAQTLGLLDAGKTPTALGRALLDTEQESDQERSVFQQSIEGSPIVAALAPRLLSPKPPTKKALAARIERLSGLSKATAEHRASDLLAWREQLLDEPEAKPEAPTESSSPEEPA
jgi:hypothetical protein